MTVMGGCDYQMNEDLGDDKVVEEEDEYNNDDDIDDLKDGDIDYLEDDNDDNVNITKTTMLMSITTVMFVLWVDTGAGLPLGYVPTGYPVQLVPVRHQ